eukprot:scaffold232251_cov34-Prasinocladus_malaysianus.AAC.1
MIFRLLAFSPFFHMFSIPMTIQSITIHAACQSTNSALFEFHSFATSMHKSELLAYPFIQSLA